MGALLVAGGRNDPNMGWLLEAAGRLGVEAVGLLVDPADPPAFAWPLETGLATLNGRPIEASCAFIRYDVFSGAAEGRQEAAVDAGSWHAALSGYCAAAGLFTLNRAIDPISASKPAMLALARSCGLAIPATLVANVPPQVREGSHIAKPVAGGSYVMELSAAVAQAKWLTGGRSPAPAIIQPKLSYPERRIFRVGRQFFAFDIGSTTLDSRLDTKCVITPMQLSALPEGLLDRIEALTDQIRCDFCAIDMKTDPESGELTFLELNNGPMFMGYDATGGGKMAEEMVRYLVAGT